MALYREEYGDRVRSIGVLRGYGAESELQDAGADGLCGAPTELATGLGRLAGQFFAVARMWITLSGDLPHHIYWRNEH
jgi:hypothetical protein